MQASTTDVLKVAKWQRADCSGRGWSCPNQKLYQECMQQSVRAFGKELGQVYNKALALDAVVGPCTERAVKVAVAR
jgi:hypothetical protein